MKKLTVLLILFAIITTDAQADRRKTDAECAAIREKIRNIESKMRAGYTRAQGERYNDKLRVLKARSHKLCR